MIRRSTHATFGLLLLATLTLTACGGKDAAPPATTATITGEEPPVYTFPPTMVANPVPADAANASDAVLNEQDLPDNWTSIKNADSIPRPFDLDEVFIECSFGPTSSQLTAYIASAVYASADSTFIARSFVRVVPSQPSAVGDFRNFKATRLSACQTDMWRRQQNFASDAPATGLKYGSAPPLKLPVEPLSSPDLSNDVLGFRMLISPSDSTPTYQDVFAYGAGRYEVVLLFMSDHGNDTKVEADAITKVRSRVFALASAAR